MTTSCHEEDYRRVVHETGPTHWIPDTDIEIIRAAQARPAAATCALRFRRHAESRPRGLAGSHGPDDGRDPRSHRHRESPEALRRAVRQFVMQSYRQADDLPDDPPGRRGPAGAAGRPRIRSVYKQMYHDRLMERIAGRREALRSGRIRARRRCSSRIRWNCSTS